MKRAKRRKPRYWGWQAVSAWLKQPGVWDIAHDCCINPHLTDGKTIPFNPRWLNHADQDQAQAAVD